MHEEAKCHRDTRERNATAKSTARKTRMNARANEAGFFIVVVSGGGGGDERSLLPYGFHRVRYIPLAKFPTEARGTEEDGRYERAG